FQPNGGCTRAQVVTFLWALSGKPNPAEGSNPFKDVKKSNWYYKAVLWAYQNGITSGVDDTHFGPNQTCTRGQVVTFLYALLGKK
ncbi:MAG: S-layer homology domain-containing protein, partial [Oscillospiraceae bacterium]|nr:S-layer homology domain-containing protein [Oscillospiraceae bacterium]